MHLVKPETLEFIFVKGKLMSKALNVFFFHDGRPYAFL